MTASRRNGFTLIELLAASALAAVLMLVLFQVIGSLGRTRAALTDRAADAGGASAVQVPWKADLLDLLRWDLANADAVKFEASGVTLAGHGALNRRRSLAPAHVPVTVSYAVEPRSGQSCLVRRQSPRGGVAGDAAWSEVVCVGVTAFELSTERTRTATRSQDRPRIAPLRLRVAGPSGLLLDETIIVR